MKRRGIRHRDRCARDLRILLALAAVVLVAGCRKAPPFAYDFEAADALDRLTWNCGTIFRVVPRHATSGALSLEMIIHPKSPDRGGYYPGISFSRFDPDWSDRGVLLFDVYNPGPLTVPLTLRIDDLADPEVGDRFARTLPLTPGGNRVEIPFAEFVTRSTGRHLDMERIHDVLLFVVNPTARTTLYLDSIRLE